MIDATFGLRTAALLACVLGAIACVAEPESAAVPESDGLAPSEASGFLYGLRQDEIASLHALVADRYELEAWIEVNRAPFDCARYGTLCRDVGEDAAYAITGESYYRALDGATLDDVNAYLSEALGQASADWAAEVEARGQDERMASDCFFPGNANNERLKVTAHAIKPLIGDWHGSADCTYQVKTLGVWGGNSSANLTCQVSGHLHTPNGIEQQVNGPTFLGFVHTLSTTDIKFFPAQPSLSQMHITADGTGNKGGWSANGSCNITF